MASRAHFQNSISNSFQPATIRKIFFCSLLLCSFLNALHATSTLNSSSVSSDGVATFLGENKHKKPRSYKATYVGNQTGSSNITDNNSLVFTGKKAVLTNKHELTVGQVGNENKLSVLHGATAKSASTTIGDIYADKNKITVSGKDSSLKTAGVLTVGNFFSVKNSLKIAHAGVAQSQETILSSNATASKNSIKVTGVGSALNNDQSLVVGQSGSHNKVKLKKGATAKSQLVVIGQADTALDNSMRAKGNGTTLTTAQLTIGQSGEGSFTLDSGAHVAADKITIAEDESSKGTMNIGREGKNDEEGTLAASVIHFGKGKAALQFNQSNKFTLETAITGGEKAIVCQQGSGRTTFTRKNSYRGKTIIDHGTLAIRDAGTLGESDNKTDIKKGTLEMGGTTQTQESISFRSANIENGTLKAKEFISKGGVNNISANLNDHKHARANLVNNGGTTRISGDNHFSGRTDINDGKVVAMSETALGRSAVNLAGGNLQLDTTLKASSVNWESTKSTLELSSGDTKLKTKHLNIVDKDQTHYIDAHVLDNKIHTAIQTKNPSDLQDTQFELTGRSSDSYTLAQNNKGTKITYQLSSNNTLDIGKHDEVVRSYRTRNTCFHEGSSLTLNKGSQFNIDENFTGDEHSVINYTVASTQDSPEINIGGCAHLNHEKLKMSFAGVAPAVGEKFAVLSASTVDGEFGDVILDIPDAANFRVRKTCVGDPVLYMGLAPTSYAQMATTPNQANVALALNSFIPATSGDQLVVSTALDALTAAEYPNAFNQISPQLYSTFTTMAFNNVNAQNNQLIQRLGNVRVAGLGFDTTGFHDSPIVNDDKNAKKGEKDILVPAADNHWGLFVDGNGIFANVNIYNQLPGYSYESGGATIGADYKWNETFSTGLYTGYQGAQSKQSGGNFICDNGSRFGAFGTYQQGGLFANALVGGDTHSYQVNRTIQFPGVNRTACSAPTAQELDSMLAAGYDVKKNNFTFGPISSLQYTYFGVQPFTETGAQSLDLSVQSQNANSLLYSLGSHVFYTWQASKNILVVPQINMAWQHEFLQNPYAINSSLAGGGGTFNYTAVAPLRDALYTGVGVTVNFAKKYDASFFYNAYAGNPQLVSQNFFASLGVKF